MAVRAERFAAVGGDAISGRFCAILVPVFATRETTFSRVPRRFVPGAVFVFMIHSLMSPVLGAQVFRDLAYVRDGSPEQRLDLVLPAPPEPARPPVPLILWIHGGSWEHGSHHQNPAQAMAGRGYAVASIGYRLSSQAKYPAQIEDCRAAVRWLRAHASEYGLDPVRFGVWGASAGGHLAALLGTAAGEKRFDVGENLEQSAAVQCVIDSFGPADLLHWGEPPLPAYLDTPNSAVARLLGGRVRDHAELARLASPVTFVDRRAAPFLILHGEDDPIVPAQQSVVLDAALRRAGVESTLVIIPGAGHGSAVFADARYLVQMAAFMDQHLLGKPPVR